MPHLPLSAAELALLAAFEQQQRWCAQPSPFTAALLAAGRAWLQADPVARLLFVDLLAADPAAQADPLAGAVPLRWAGALHHLALLGRTPWSALWPTGAAAPALPSPEALAHAVQAAWLLQQPLLKAALAHAPQTNEVQRSAALLPGLLHLAQASGLPLALCELGASAGLNLWPERHRVHYGAWSTGPADAALQLQADWRGPVPAYAQARLQVAERAACDAQPVDLQAPGEALRLTSFIWPDQADRLARLRRALQLVPGWLAAEGVAVRAQDAAAFVAEQLVAPRPGRCTVLLHSIVWQYLPAATQAAIRQHLAQAGARATAEAPLAWLRLEPPAADQPVELRCTLWPGGADQRLALAHPHGAWLQAEPATEVDAPPAHPQAA
jgi:hypothetical protein